jgi:hypothetical protein
MVKKTVILLFFVFVVKSITEAQGFIKTKDFFPAKDKTAGELNIIQDQRIDTLITRYILSNKNLNGMEGFRIQIFRSSLRNARDESNKARAEFINDFPDIPSYALYSEPGYFIVRAGDFRTRVEGTKFLFLVRKKFPNAYLVPDIINYPDQLKK